MRYFTWKLESVSNILWLIVDKAYFQHDMAHGDLKDLRRRTASDKVLRDKAFDITKNRNHDGYQRSLLQWSITFFIKRL